MKFSILDAGKIIMRNGNQVALSNDGEAARESWIPVPCYLIETDDGCILFDTGCDPEGMTKNWPDYLRANPFVLEDDRQLPRQLEAMGISPDRIRYIVLSHLHADHAGGLKLFPGANIIVSGEEFRKTMRAYAGDEMPDFYLRSDIEGALRAECSWTFIDAPGLTRLNDHVSVINLGAGHAYGMLGLLVKTEEDGNFILAADAIYTREHYNHPEIPAGIVYDVEGYQRTIAYIRSLAEECDARIIYGHDPEQFLKLRKHPNACYR